MIFADKLIMGVEMFPTGLTPPTSYTTQTIVNLSGTASYYVGVINDCGWYRIRVGAADGAAGSSDAITPGCGGYATKIFYAFTGAKYLIWGAHETTTGYPWPQGNGNEDGLGILGGGGGRSVWTTVTSGGHFNPQTGTIVGQTTIVTAGAQGGGSPTGNGGTETPGTYVGTKGGGGAGFVCGIDFMGTTATSETEAFSDHTFSVDSVIAMVLAGGGGGCSGYGGGGGGAWGNGGNGANPWSGYGPGTGPGGTTGVGGTAPGAGNGGDGAWAIRDYSTNTFSYGTGINGRPATEVCVLEKLIY